MAYELKKKDVINSNYIVFSIGYCGVQYLLHYKQRLGYTCSRTYGWQSDIYQMEPGIVISTGYGPFGIPVPYELYSEYDKKAEKIVYNPKIKNPDKELDSLIKEFMEKAVKYAEDNKLTKFSK